MPRGRRRASIAKPARGGGLRRKESPRRRSLRRWSRRESHESAQVGNSARGTRARFFDQVDQHFEHRFVVGVLELVAQALLEVDNRTPGVGPRRI